MNMFCAGSTARVDTRLTDRCGLFLIFIILLSLLCNGCIGLTSAGSKNGGSPSTTPPTIAITAPAQGASVSGVVPVMTSVSTNTISVQFKVDGANSGAAVVGAPFEYSLDSTKLTDGTHTLTAEAMDAAGLSTLSASVSIAVANAGAPSISITSPASGATVSGTVAVSTSVSSNTTSVQFKVDGANSGAAATSAPFGFSLNTSGLSNGSHSLAAVARNSSGQTATSATVAITVSNSSAPSISITSPTSGATVAGTVAVSTSVSSNTTSVQFKVDGANSGGAVTSAPFGFSLNTAALSNGNHTLAAVATNSANQTATSATVTITVNNSSAPSISITSPASGATVSGTVAVSTSVSSNTASVQFKVDGANSGAAVTSAPFGFSLNTTALSNGSHTLAAVATNSANQTATSATVTITVNNSSAPSISITSPASGATVSGTVAVSTSVSSNTASVQFKVDGANSGAAVTSAPFGFSLNTTALSNGSHTLAAVATNSANQTATSATVTITVNNSSAPTISITSPTSGATVSGTVAVSTSVSSNTASVQFKVDGANSGGAVTSAPFGFSLNTTALSNGSHTLAAVATNSANQTATSATVTITVNNSSAPTISITSPTSGATVSGTVAVSTSVSSNTTSVQFKVDGTNSGAAVTSAPFGLSLNTAALSNGSHTLAAVATNSANQTATSATVTITVNNSSAPSISITSPASGATVSGTVAVSTSVSSNTTSVQFKVDGANSGGAVTSAPFGFSLNTTALPNGSHTLAAVASNSANQTATSATVTITVNNATATPPTVSITSPTSGATVSGTVNVLATASDSVGVTKVEFYLDNALQVADTSSPYSWSWNTVSSTNGSHTVMAKAYNGAGGTASASVTVTVSNGGSGGGGGSLTPSGPISISGQSGVTIQNMHIANPNGDCVTISNGTNITIRQSEIGPCGGNGIVITGGNTINVFDNYVHPEGALSGCCDINDGIFADGSSNLTIQGNVIAFGEANIEATNQTKISVIGNFFLNPRGGASSRGQNVQVWGNSTTVLVQNNYTLSSTDTSIYAFAEVQEDSINFGSNLSGVIAQGNYVTGGHSNSGCGIIADTGTLSVQFLNNTILNSGQCGIGITDGANAVVDGNKILNTTPVNGGGNTGIYVWKVNASDPPCGPVQVSNNIVSAIASDGTPNSFWNGGGCDPVTLTNNTFDGAAAQALSPAAQKIPPPLIPPQPKNCAIASPFTNNTSVPPCGGSGSGSTGNPPTISISSPTSGATVSGTVAVSTSVSSNTTSVQFKVDGANSGAAVTSAPFSFSLNTAALSNGSHSLAAVASNSANQTASSATVTITVNNSSAPSISITSPASGATVSGTVAVSTSVSSNTTSVQFKVDGANSGAAVTSTPFGFSLNTAALSNGSHSLAAVASNSANQTATSATVTITVNNSSAPTISISSPTSGATVSGTVAVSTSVSSNTTSVQFKVDGANSGAAVTSAPFGFSLNTAALSNGSHSLAAVASNSANQTATSATVTITVNNSSAPTISITSPTSGATVSGTIAVSTSVSSNTTSVQFKVDGNNSGAAVTSAPFGLSLNTKTLSNGSHSLTATASNSAAQSTTSAAIAIIVNNPILSIMTTSFPNGPVQASYSATLQASGGTSPYTWSVLSGQLPTGLTLASSSGTISGTPTAAGSFSFTIQVKDNASATTSAAFSINITTPTTPPPTSAPFGHVLLLALENANYTDAIGSSSMPYLNSLANQYGLATQYYADTHPSIGNYLMWTTGQILTNDDGQTPNSFPVSVDNVVRELIASGNSWKQYAESIPSVGYIGGDSTCCGGTFITRHAPLPYLTDAQAPSQANNIVPFTQFATDLSNNALPKYSFITPNGCNDAHDCGLDVADSWLKTNIDPLIKSAQFQKDGLLIIAFDESNTDNTNGGGRVAAIIISPFAKPGFKSTTLYQHESVLRLMLEGLGIKVLPGAAATAPKMWEFFTFTPPT